LIPELAISLKFRQLSDFGPEGVALQVPALRQLLELRQALTALKGPLGNNKKLRDLIQQLLGDSGARQKLMGELGIKSEGG
jgi:type VI secretion system protein ImpB